MRYSVFLQPAESKGQEQLIEQAIKYPQVIFKLIIYYVNTKINYNYYNLTNMIKLTYLYASIMQLHGENTLLQISSLSQAQINPGPANN